eukprot:Clim_evm2s68 gene=Clim_evmTU2s68
MNSQAASVELTESALSTSDYRGYRATTKRSSHSPCSAIEDESKTLVNRLAKVTIGKSRRQLGTSESGIGTQRNRVVRNLCGIITSELTHDISDPGLAQKTRLEAIKRLQRYSVGDLLHGDGGNDYTVVQHSILQTLQTEPGQGRHRTDDCAISRALLMYIDKIFFKLPHQQLLEFLSGLIQVLFSLAEDINVEYDEEKAANRNTANRNAAEQSILIALRPEHQQALRITHFLVDVVYSRALQVCTRWPEQSVLDLVTLGLKSVATNKDAFTCFAMVNPEGTWFLQWMSKHNFVRHIIFLTSVGPNKRRRSIDESFMQKDRTIVAGAVSFLLRMYTEYSRRACVLSIVTRHGGTVGLLVSPARQQLLLSMNALTALLCSTEGRQCVEDCLEQIDKHQDIHVHSLHQFLQDFIVVGRESVVDLPELAKLSTKHTLQNCYDALHLDSDARVSVTKMIELSACVYHMLLRLGEKDLLSSPDVLQTIIECSPFCTGDDPRSSRVALNKYDLRNASLLHAIASSSKGRACLVSHVVSKDPRRHMIQLLIERILTSLQNHQPEEPIHQVTLAYLNICCVLCRRPEHCKWAVAEHDRASGGTLLACVLDHASKILMSQGMRHPASALLDVKTARFAMNGDHKLYHPSEADKWQQSLLPHLVSLSVTSLGAAQLLKLGADNRQHRRVLLAICRLAVSDAFGPVCTTTNLIMPSTRPDWHGVRLLSHWCHAKSLGLALLREAGIIDYAVGRFCEMLMPSLLVCTEGGLYQTPAAAREEGQGVAIAQMSLPMNEEEGAQDEVASRLALLAAILTSPHLSTPNSGTTITFVTSIEVRVQERTPSLDPSSIETWAFYEILDLILHQNVDQCGGLAFGGNYSSLRRLDRLFREDLKEESSETLVLQMLCLAARNLDTFRRLADQLLLMPLWRRQLELPVLSVDQSDVEAVQIAIDPITIRRQMILVHNIVPLGGPLTRPGWTNLCHATLLGEPEILLQTVFDADLPYNVTERLQEVMLMARPTSHNGQGEREQVMRGLGLLVRRPLHSPDTLQVRLQTMMKTNIASSMDLKDCASVGDLQRRLLARLRMSEQLQFSSEDYFTALSEAAKHAPWDGMENCDSKPLMAIHGQQFEASPAGDSFSLALGLLAEHLCSLSGRGPLPEDTFTHLHHVITLSIASTTDSMDYLYIMLALASAVHHHSSQSDEANASEVVATACTAFENVFRAMPVTAGHAACVWWDRDSEHIASVAHCTAVMLADEVPELSSALHIACMPITTLITPLLQSHLLTVLDLPLALLGHALSLTFGARMQACVLVSLLKTSAPAMLRDYQLRTNPLFATKPLVLSAEDQDAVAGEILRLWEKETVVSASGM